MAAANRKRTVTAFQLGRTWRHFDESRMRNRKGIDILFIIDMMIVITTIR